MRKTILYIATSLDGFIAQTDGNIDFLSIVEQAGEDYGYTDFIQTIDTVIVGRKTYDKVLAMGYDFPHSDKNAYIITHTPREAIGSVQFYTNDLLELVRNLKSETGKNIFIDSGAEVVSQLLAEQLIDELYISIIPILLGEGIRLFKDGLPQQRLQLIDSKQFTSGLVQLHYQKM
jgi:dihydrofolate reductase